MQSVDTGWVVCVSFLDLQKAFDSLIHCILLQRICDLGISREVLQELFVWSCTLG